MGKIFHLNSRKGSFIDQISEEAAVVNAATTFSRTDKGLCINKDTDNTSFPVEYTGLDDWSGKELSFVFAYNIRKEDGAFVNCMFQRADFYCFLQSSRTNMNISAVTFTVSTVPLNEWQFCIITLNSSNLATLYMNGEYIDANTISVSDVSGDFNIMDRNLGGRDWNGNMWDFIVYDHVLTEKERAKLYQEFLRSTPITRQIQ